MGGMLRICCVPNETRLMKKTGLSRLKNFEEILKTGLAKTADADILKSCCVPHGMRLIEN